MNKENIIYLKTFQGPLKEKKAEETEQQESYELGEMRDLGQNQKDFHKKIKEMDDPLEDLLSEFKNFEANEENEPFQDDLLEEEIARVSQSVLDIKEKIERQMKILKEIRSRFNYYIDEIEVSRDE